MVKPFVYRLPRAVKMFRPPLVTAGMKCYAASTIWKGGQMFKQVKQNKAYQDVVVQIQEAIIAGSIKPGSQLPAERELKEQFGISRGTLREALRVLEQKGLIEIRTGVAGGSIVREVNSEQL